MSQCLSSTKISLVSLVGCSWFYHTACASEGHTLWLYNFLLTLVINEANSVGERWCHSQKCLNSLSASLWMIQDTQQLILHHRSVQFVSFTRTVISSFQEIRGQRSFCTCCSLYEVSEGNREENGWRHKALLLLLRHSVALLSSCYCAEILERAQTEQSAAPGQLEVMIQDQMQSAEVFPYNRGNPGGFIYDGFWRKVSNEHVSLYMKACHVRLNISYTNS